MFIFNGLSHSFFVMGASSYPVASGFHVGVQLLAHVISPLDGIRSVCRCRQPVIEQPELLLQPLHVRVVLLPYVENEPSRPVQRFQITFYTYEFSRFIK